MANYTIVETYHGRRMDIRIVATVFCGLTHYKIQYQYSKKNDTWLNFIGSDFNKGSEAYNNSGHFDRLSAAKAAARRKLRNNNAVGTIGVR